MLDLILGGAFLRKYYRWPLIGGCHQRRQHSPVFKQNMHLLLDNDGIFGVRMCHFDTLANNMSCFPSRHLDVYKPPSIKQ